MAGTGEPIKPCTTNGYIRPTHTRTSKRLSEVRHFHPKHNPKNYAPPATHTPPTASPRPKSPIRCANDQKKTPKSPLALLDPPARSTPRPPSHPRPSHTPPPSSSLGTIHPPLPTSPAARGPRTAHTDTHRPRQPVDTGHPARFTTSTRNIRETASSSWQRGL